MSRFYRYKRRAYKYPDSTFFEPTFGVQASLYEYVDQTTLEIKAYPNYDFYALELDTDRKRTFNACADLFDEINERFNAFDFCYMRQHEKRPGSIFFMNRVPRSLGSERCFGYAPKKGFISFDLDTHVGKKYTMLGKETDLLIETLADLISAGIAGFNIRKSSLAFTTASAGVHVTFVVPEHLNKKLIRRTHFARGGKFSSAREIETLKEIAFSGKWKEVYSGDPDELTHLATLVEAYNGGHDKKHLDIRAIAEKFFGGLSGKAPLPLDIKAGGKKAILKAPILGDNRYWGFYKEFSYFDTETPERIEVLNPRTLELFLDTLTSKKKEANQLINSVCRLEKDGKKAFSRSDVNKMGIAELREIYAELLLDGYKPVKSKKKPKKTTYSYKDYRNRSFIYGEETIKARMSMNKTFPTYHQERAYVHRALGCCMSDNELISVMTDRECDWDSYTGKQIPIRHVERDLIKLRRKFKYSGHGFACPNNPANIISARSISMKSASVSFEEYSKKRRLKVEAKKSNPRFYRDNSEYRVLSLPKLVSAMYKQKIKPETQIFKDLITLYGILQGHANTGMKTSILGLDYLSKFFKGSRNRAKKTLAKARQLKLIYVVRWGAKGVLPSYKINEDFVDKSLTRQYLKLLKIKSRGEFSLESYIYSDYTGAFYSFDGVNKPKFVANGCKPTVVRVLGDINENKTLRSLKADVLFMLDEAQLMKPAKFSYASAKLIMKRKIEANVKACKQNRGKWINSKGWANHLAVYKHFMDSLNKKESVPKKSNNSTSITSIDKSPIINHVPVESKNSDYVKTSNEAKCSVIIDPGG